MKDNNIEFLHDCAKYIRGEMKEVRLRGDKKDCILFAGALKESRNLYQTLNEEDPSISSVVKALGQKHKATRELKKKTGFAWPF